MTEPDFARLRAERNAEVDRLVDAVLGAFPGAVVTRRPCEHEFRADVEGEPGRCIWCDLDEFQHVMEITETQ